MLKIKIVFFFFFLIKLCIAGNTYSLSVTNIPSKILPDTKVALNINGGIPPYQIMVYGNGFAVIPKYTYTDTFILHVHENACGSAQIIVSDYNAQSTESYVRVENGKWALKSINVFCLVRDDQLPQWGW